jgi:acyl-CoA dehydrogenase
MTSFSFRRDIITKPIFSWARNVLPAMSDTEREALEAGDVWWHADLFTGNPDWSKLLGVAPATLTSQEQAFLSGPVDELCAMVDDWKINWEWRDLPPETWDFIKRRKFFGMIIPKQYGGLGFSPYAHSEVVRKLSSRSLTAAVTVMVPNSLGPGELLMRARIHDWQEAVQKGVITQAEGDQLAVAHLAVSKVIEVDDFAPEALSPIYKRPADVHQFFQELGEQRAAS